MNQAQELGSGITKLGLKVAPEQQQKLLIYLALLQKWNKVYNLTAIRQPSQMVSHHLLDSLAVLPYLSPGRWLDVGCGGGLPGLVLALMCPESTFTLLDSNSKKTSFVQQAIIEMGLQNVFVHCGRVEDLQIGAPFEGIISRAFAGTAEFVTLTRHLLAQNGRWIAMKGVSPDEELSHLPADIKVEQVVPLQVPGLDAARCLVILKAT